MVAFKNLKKVAFKNLKKVTFKNLKKVALKNLKKVKALIKVNKLCHKKWKRFQKGEDSDTF